MCLNNLGKWPPSGNHIVFLEDNDISNLDISSGMVPFGVVSEWGDVFCGTSARSGEQELDISANAVVERVYDRRKQDLE